MPVVDAVEQGGIHVDEKNGRILECDFERLEELLVDDFPHRHICLVNLGLRFHIGIAGCFPESMRTAIKDVGTEGLGEEEKHEKEDWAVEPQDRPQSPSPILVLHREATYDGS